MKSLISKKNKKINIKEIETLDLLLKKCPPLPNIPSDVFVSIMSRNVPVTIELGLRRRNKICLVYRNDKFYRGWHFPGSFLKPGESIKHACRRIAREELGVLVKNISFRCIFNETRDKRFHYVSLFFVGDAVGKIMKGALFDSLPKDILVQHRKLWQETSSVSSGVLSATNL